MKFRLDIQGIRAVAVLLVFVFHLDREFLSGGFIGVDVFFVISGYLMAGIISQKIENKSFKIIDFYIGRLQRLWPVYTIVLLIVLIVSILIYMTGDIGGLIRNVLWSSMFLSNIYFSSLDTYFGASSNENPLLHTWTLAIEMQFYVFLPILLLLFKKATKYVTIVLLIIFLSYSVFNVYSLNNSDKMYFSLAARVPEFFIGSLFFYYKDYIKIKHKTISNLAAFGCLTIILFCAIYINHQHIFPGWIVLLPCIATGFLISEEDSLINRKLLSHKTFVFLGQISYSLYLVHWPIMALTRYYNSEYHFSTIEIIVIVLATLLISVAFYFTVENQFRKSNKARLAAFILTIYILIAIGLVQFRNLNKKLAYLPVEFSQQTFGLTSHGNTFEHMERLGEKEHPIDSFFLLGDSHALSYKRYLDLFGKENRYLIKTITNNAFPNITGISKNDINSERLYRQYSKLVNLTSKEIENMKNIIIVSYWPEDVKSLPTAITGFVDSLSFGQKLIILPVYPTVGKNPLKLNRSHLKIKKIVYAKTEMKIPKYVYNLEKNRPSLYVVNLNFSNFGNDFPYNNDTIMYFDGAHLNKYGAEILYQNTKVEFAKQIQSILNSQTKK